MLQTPALIPYYAAKGVEITEYVIKNLNIYYPSPKPTEDVPSAPVVPPQAGKDK